MKEQLFNFAINKPKWVFGLVLTFSLICGGLIFNIQIDTDPENMLPSDQPERVFHNQVKEQFQLHDMIVVGLVTNNKSSVYQPETLKSIATLSQEIEKINGVIALDLMSLQSVDNITQDNGALRFEWLMRSAPDSIAGSEQIKAAVDRLPLFRNTLVSADDNAAAIYVPIKDKDESYRISKEIESLISQLESEEDFHITGLPVAEDTFGFEMFVQMGISAPLAAAMIFVLLFVFFRNLKFIAAPMIIAMATVIIIMGLMIGMGFTVHIMSSMIPIFLMPIAVVDSVHIMSEFADKFKHNSNKQLVIKQVVNALYKPMLFTSLTSAVGFASLMLTPIPPVQVFGAFVAVGILLAFILTIIFLPAYLMSLKDDALKSLSKVQTTASKLETVLPKIGKISFGYAKWLVAGFVLLVALSAWGISKIEINDNPTRWFKSDHKIRVADQVLNQHFAGTYDAYLVLQTDLEAERSNLDEIIKANGVAINQELPLGTMINEALQKLEEELFEKGDDQKIENAIESLEQLKTNVALFQNPENLKAVELVQQALIDTGLVGKTMSLADAVKTVTRELKSGDDKDYRLPRSQSGVAEALLQYQSSHRPHDLWHLTSKDYASTVIWLQMKSGDNQDMTRIVEAMQEYFDKNPLPENISAKWAGKTYLNKVWQDEMVQGMLTSLLSAFAVVFIMMVLLFRSVWLGLIAMLPLTITITAIYGLIGWMGKDYDMPIAVLSALTLGLSVDFAIHFVQRSRDLYKSTGSVSKAFSLMFKEPATAISRNAIVIAIGFTPLLVAPLMPYVTVGFFLATIMAVSAVVTLFLLPICLKARGGKLL